MAEAKQNKPWWRRRIIFAILALMLLAVLALISLRVFITTASGSRFIEEQVNSRSFGPVASVNISGLSGDPLKAFSISKVEIKDEKGVWLDAEDITIEWSPFALIQRTLKIEQLDIQKADAFRRPIINETTASESEPYRLSVPDVQISTLTLHEALIGLNADFKVTGGAALTGGEISAHLNALRTDIKGDSFDVKFNRNQKGSLDGIFDIRAEANGPIARLMRAPVDKAVTGTGTLKGTSEDGTGQFNLVFGESNAATGDVFWTEDTARLNTNVNIAQWNAFQAARERIGNTVTIIGSVENRGGAGYSNAPFRFDVKAPKLTIQTSGKLPEDGLIPTQMDLELNTQKLSDLSIFPEGYEGGKGTVIGTFINATNPAFQGRIDFENLISPYGKAKRLSGPVSASQSEEDIYNYDGNLTLEALTLSQDMPIAISDSAQISSEGKLNLRTRQLNFETTKLSTGANKLTVQGQAGWEPLTYDVAGDAVAAVLAQGSIPAGQFEMGFKIKQTETSAAALNADGVFKPSDQLDGPAGAVIGENLTFKTRMSPVDGGIQISEAQISGDNIRAAIEGRITDSYALSGEAMLTSSLPLPSITLGENSDVSFELSGPRTDPDLRLDAASSKVIISGQTLTTPRMRIEVQDLFNAPKGPLQIEAKTEYGDLVLTSQFASRPGIYAAEDMTFKLGDLTANGDLSVAESNLATGQFELDLPQEGDRFARATLAFAPVGIEQGLSLSIDAKSIALQQYEFDHIKATADGTLANLSGTVKTKGRRNISLLSRGFELDTPFDVSRNADNFIHLQMSPRGKYGDIGLGSSGPVAFKYGNHTIALNAPLTISGQAVSLNYSKQGLSETLTVDTANLPINLVPMPGNLADTLGQAAINFKLESNGAGVTGGGDLELTDWRGFDVKRENGINALTSISLNGNRGDIKLKGQSVSGFTVSGNSKFGLSNANTLMALRLDNAAPVSGELNMSGAASSVLGLVTPSDAELGGDLTASLRLSGTANAPLIDGRAAGTDIRFEAPELGTRIRKGRFTTAFQNDRLSVTDLYVQDADKGTLSGKGEFTLGELGRPLGSLEINAKKFRALDRRDVQGVVSGKLAYLSRQDDAELVGEIGLNEAEIKQFITGGKSVIEIEVDEINPPETVQTMNLQDTPLPVNVNIKVRAPREIYVRSRGLDVELSVDMDITGAIDDPLFNGKAEVVRGGYKLAGKTLEFTDGAIEFNGALPDAKLSLLAETDTTDITAQIQITGTVEKPTIELTSSPERPQDEILSVLLFGRSATELSSIEAAQLAGALAQFSGSGAGFDLLGGLRDAFGIGQLSIGFAEDGTAQISGGRYLAKNVYLQVFSGAGQDQTGAVIEWEIRKNLSLRSRLQADNDQAFSLKYKKDF